MPSALLDIADLLNVPQDGIETDLLIPPAEQDWAARELRGRFQTSPVVGLHPGTGGSACNLSARAYETMARQIMAETGWSLVLTGTASERRLLVGWPPELLRSPRVWNTMGELSLRQLGGVIQRMALYLVPPTGPLHIAGSFRVPTLSPFCPVPCMAPPVWGPQTGRAHFIVPRLEQCRDFSLRKKNICDFSGKITPAQIVAEAKRIVGA